MTTSTQALTAAVTQAHLALFGEPTNAYAWQETGEWAKRFVERFPDFDLDWVEAAVQVCRDRGYQNRTRLREQLEFAATRDTRPGEKPRDAVRSADADREAQARQLAEAAASPGYRLRYYISARDRAERIGGGWQQILAEHIAGAAPGERESWESAWEAAK